MHSIDIAVQTFLTGARTTGVTEFMYLLTTIFDLSLQFIMTVLCLAILIYLMRGRKYAVLFSLALIVGGILIYFLKIFFDVSRPINAIVNVFGKSFPSGHATTATIFFGMLIYIFDNYLKPFGRIIFNTFCVVMILLVSFSRLYLGAHWLSDVIGGILLGLIVVFISIKWISPRLINMLK